MYDEMVNSLRICGKMRSADDYCVAFHDGCCEAEPVCMYELMMKAADAIEELGRLADAIPHVCECCIGCEVESGGGCDRAFVLSPKRAREYLSKPRWIPVTERLPEHGQEVLCACKAGIYEVFKYVDGISGPWYKDSRHVYMKGFVTHWMPLPQPPEEEV